MASVALLDLVMSVPAVLRSDACAEWGSAGERCASPVARTCSAKPAYSRDVSQPHLDARAIAEPATHTFLFTDIEASTSRWQTDPERMASSLASHDETLRGIVAAHHGRVFKHTGDGLCAVFASVHDAVSAAVEAQRSLEVPVRMAVHTGDAIERDGDFFGMALNRCARLVEAAHGGQVLISRSAGAVGEQLGGHLALRDLGEHRLRDLGEPERIFQVVAPGLEESFGPLRSLDAVRNNLPVIRSSFIGRERELSELCARVEKASLITLVGIGGAGKTRLALEAAARVTGQFPQGVFFVDLAVLADAGLVWQSLADALDLQIAEPDLASLAGYLAERKVLIVLDNCEHLLDACAKLADGLLSRCPQLRIVATSREPLGLEGEEISHVPSLTADTDAVRLFNDRARAAGARPASDAAGEAAVTEICRRLDGIPLAIELAAARTTHLGVEQILERLSDRFGLLTGGRRRVGRQQTLAAAMDWSYDLLDEPERMLFRRLAVFRGSFSLEAAEAVGGTDAVDLLGSLVTKSLVIAQQDGGRVRYRMLETVRAYAEERLLASGETVEVRSLHRDWLLAWLESVPVAWMVQPWLGDEFAAEADNVMAAMEWAREQGRLDLVARMAPRMMGVWISNYRAAELAMWSGLLMERQRDVPEELRPGCLLVRAVYAQVAGDFDEMERLSAEALRLAPPGSWEAAYALMVQALYWPYADRELARRRIDEARRAAEAAGTPELGWTAASWSANLLTGDPERDVEVGGQELLDGLLESDQQTGTSWAGFVLLTIAAALGQTQKASRLADQVAVNRSGTALRYSRAVFDSVVAIAEGQSGIAAARLCEMAAIVHEHAIPLGEPSCLTCIAALAAIDGEHERASRLLACVRNAARFPFRTPAEALVYRQTVRRVRDALDAETAERCRAEGGALPVDQVLGGELERLSSIARSAGQLRAERSASAEPPAESRN